MVASSAGADSMDADVFPKCQQIVARRTTSIGNAGNTSDVTHTESKNVVVRLQGLRLHM